jgi:hypothetical protein
MAHEHCGDFGDRGLGTHRHDIFRHGLLRIHDDTSQAGTMTPSVSRSSSALISVNSVALAGKH